MGFKGKSISVASYDTGNRLTAWNRAGADENNSQTWNYDDAGNWNSTTKDGDTEGRDHSVSNQITQLDGKAVSHDLKGNLTEYEYDRTDYRVKYDLDNRIVEVKADSETIRYRYDALERRIVSKGDDETILIWWGDSECAEFEHRASQDAIQNDIMGHPTRLNSVIAGDTEDRENRVELQWYHKNYLDHIYAVSDDNGNLIEHYRYTAFGEPEIYSATGVRRNTSAIGNTVMWNTRRYDADNGLYYYKYRHYAANMGRWLGRDPIEEHGGINLYGFVSNEPLGTWDILGLDDAIDYFESQGTSIFLPGPLVGQPSKKQLEELENEVEKANKIEDKDGNICYMVDIRYTPLNADGVMALGGMANSRAIFASHSVANANGSFTIQLHGGEEVNSSKLRSNVEVIGCHLCPPHGIPQANATERIINKVKALKAKKCCIPIEYILIAGGAR